MKINEITNEGLLGAIGRGLDRLGGGTGNIGNEKYRQSQTQKQLTGEAGRLYQAFAETLKSIENLDVNKPDTYVNDVDTVAKTAARTVQAYANNKLGQAGQQFVTQLIQKLDPYLPRSNNPSIVNTYPEKLKQYFDSAVKITDALQAQTVQVSSKQLNDPAQLYLVREPTTNNLYVKKGAGGWNLWTGTDWNTEWNKTTPVQANDTKTLNQIEKLVQKGEYRAVTTPQTPSLNTNPAATYNMPRQNIPVTPRNIP